MPSEQETGGQRKELPLVRWYGYTQMNGSVLRGRKKQKKGFPLEVK